MADSAKPQDLPAAGASARRFSAFISYSHADEKFVRRLHRKLEGYRLPQRLLKTHGAAAGHRLKPLFRDSDELSASYDLSAAVREAIAASDHMIVVGSPASATSVWVGREIEEFRALHGDQGILATIIAGSSETAFHPALHGRPGGPKLSPLAADFRREGGGQRLALLRLVAALAGVHLDDLVHRDAQRQVRRIAVAGTGAVVGITIVAALAVYGLIARHDAEAQRARAGGLNAFMLTDLRKGLQSAGRLDLLTAVNQAALDSYKGQDLSRLPAETLEQRAQALQAAGEDNEKRGDLKTAQAQFVEARRTTAALLAAKPDDPQRIYNQAQSEYWVGFVNWRKGNTAAARAGFEAYAMLAQRLLKLDPGNADWRSEVGYAESNLGSLALRQDGDLANAKRHFAASLQAFQMAAARKPGDFRSQINVADGYAWRADLERLQGDLAGATASRAAQRQLLDRLLAADPRNAEVRENLLYADLAVARIDADRGLFAKAIEELDRGHAAALALERSDPANAQIAKERRVFELFKVRTLLSMPAAKRPSSSNLLTMLSVCTPANAALVDDELYNFCTVLQARVLADSGDIAAAQRVLASRHPPAHPEAYSKRWGLSFVEEAKPIHLTQKGGRN